METHSVGTFLNNQYHKGRYTIKSSGEYFEGTFKNEQPFNGYWYNKKNKILSEMKNGKVL